MADFNALQALINAYIKQNGVKAITGQVLNGVLTGMVSALGKGYTVAGEASPATDPGTMTGPVSYIAHTAGTYTHFGNLVVEQGEVAMLIFDEAEWHKEVLLSLSADATIDGNVGTPEVGVSFVDGVLTFDFRNMKGNPGVDGLDGAAAGFGSVTATVDANIGTPAVEVQTSGPDTAKNFAFAFRNLKGETGVTSVVVTVDNTTGTPSCAVSLVGQVLHLDFTGLKGAQGDTGSSVDYPFTIVNNLTTDDATQALSAAMGVQLESEVSQLEAEVDDNTNDIDSLQNQLDNYQPIVIEGDVTNAPDEEDITTDENDLLKFANRAAHTNYLGYVILRKGKTFASQVTVPNTIYEIRYDFSLEQDEVVTIPTGCVLNFVGGSVKSGSIVFQNTHLSGGISFIGVSASGSIANEESRPEWFGAKRDGITDDADAVNSAISVSNNLNFSPGTYCIEKPIYLNNRTGVEINGNGAKLYCPSYTKGGSYGNARIVFSIVGCDKINFRGLSFESTCDKTGTPPTGHTRNQNLSSNIHAISILGTDNLRIEYCTFKNMEADFFFNAASQPCDGITIDGWKSEGTLMPFYGSGLSNLIIKNAEVSMSEYSGDGDHALYIGSSDHIDVFDSVFNIFNGNTESATLLTFHGTYNSKNLNFINVRSDRCCQFIHFGECGEGKMKNCYAKSTITGQNSLIQAASGTGTQTDITIEDCTLINNVQTNMFAISGADVTFTIRNCDLYNSSDTTNIFSGGKEINVENSRMRFFYVMLYASAGYTTKASFTNCIFECLRNSTGGYLFSMRDSSDTLFLFNCLFRSKITQPYAMYNGTGLTDINFVTILSSQILSFTQFAQNANNHGGNFVNTYINGALMVANP